MAKAPCPTVDNRIEDSNRAQTTWTSRERTSPWWSQQKGVRRHECESGCLDRKNQSANKEALPSVTHHRCVPAALAAGEGTLCFCRGSIAVFRYQCDGARLFLKNDYRTTIKETLPPQQTIGSRDDKPMPSMSTPAANRVVASNPPDCRRPIQVTRTRISADKGKHHAHDRSRAGHGQRMPKSTAYKAPR